MAQSLAKLAQAAKAEKTAPRIIAKTGPLELEESLVFVPASPKHNATSAAPIVCPIKRPIATTPLAPPLLCAGALDNMAFKLGD